MAPPGWKTARRGGALLVPESPPWSQYFSGSRPQAGHTSLHRRLGVLPRLRAGTRVLPGLLAFSPYSACQVCAVPGRTTLRPEPDGERQGAAVSRNPHPSCQPPGGSNRPYTGAASPHPGPSAQLEGGAPLPRVAHLCAHSPRGTPVSVPPAGESVDSTDLRVQEG